MKIKLLSACLIAAAVSAPAIVAAEDGLLDIPQLKPLSDAQMEELRGTQVMGVNGMNGLNGLNGMNGLADVRRIRFGFGAAFNNKGTNQINMPIQSMSMTPSTPGTPGTAGVMGGAGGAPMGTMGGLGGVAGAGGAGGMPGVGGSNVVVSGAIVGSIAGP